MVSRIPESVRPSQDFGHAINKPGNSAIWCRILRRGSLRPFFRSVSFAYQLHVYCGQAARNR